MILSKLALRQLKKNQKRTWLTLLGICLSTAMITAILLFYESADSFLARYAGGTGEAGMRRESPAGAAFLFSSCGILELLMVLSAVLMIRNTFRISVNERIRQFGLLKSAGATREQLMRSVLTEALLLSAAAVPAGILLGFLSAGAAAGAVNVLLSDVLNSISGGAGGRLGFVFPLPAAGSAALLSVLTVFGAAWFPAGKAARISAAEAVKLTGEIRITPRRRPKRIDGRKKKPVSGWVLKRLGAEGMLAVKFRRRDRSRCRTAELSLAAVIILVMTSFSFSENLRKAGEIRFPDRPESVNARVTLAGEDPGLLKEQIGRLALPEEGRTWITYTCVYRRDGKSGGDSATETKTAMVQLHFCQEEAFQALCDELSIESSLRTEHAGILLVPERNEEPGQAAEDFVGKEASGEVREERLLLGEEGEIYVSVAGRSKRIPEGVVPLFGEEAENIILSEEAMPAFVKEGDKLMAVVSVAAEDSGEFCERAEQFADSLDGTKISVRITDLEGEWKQEKSTGLFLAYFILCFSCILSVPAVISVMTTISAGVAFRRREFALLRSAGMTEAAIRKMLSCEGFFSGAAALLIGIPGGIFGSYLAYRHFPQNFPFPYTPPWKGMLLCAGFVFLLLFLTWRQNFHEREGRSLIETIREETI